MKKDEHKHKATKQASAVIAIGSIIGLTVCFGIAIMQQVTVPIFLYAIFGGGILGTENIVRLIKSIFRVGDE